MLRLSKLTDYAIVILSYMASDTANLHTATEIAEATGIAAPTVAKLLKLLVNAQIALSARGVKGGYNLAQAPEAISVASIISALEGPIALTECSTVNSQCEQANGCRIRANWRVLNQAIYNALAAVTLADMLVSVNVPQEVYLPVTQLSRHQ